MKKEEQKPKRKSRREELQEELDLMVPDRAEQARMIQGLYEGKPLFGEEGIFTDLLQRMVNASLQGEMDAFLDKEGGSQDNRRNGKKSKRVRSSGGYIEVSTPRDRNGEFAPMLVKNWERELHTGMDDIIISLYARGNSIDDIHYLLRKIYGVEMSVGVISAITDRILPEVSEWQNRPLHACYPVVYLDGIYFKVREEGRTASKVIHTCYGINAYGQREVLGLYASESEGAKSWGLILEDLKRRGVEDVFIFCVDGLKGFREVLEDVYPMASVQRCVVHMIRSSTRYVKDKDIKKLCSDLRVVYQSSSREMAAVALQAFGKKWDATYPEVRKKWEDTWEELMTFMDYTPAIRKMIYTTNSVEAVHRVMRKVTKTKAAWPSVTSLIKQLYLVLMHNKKSWGKDVFNWKSIEKELICKYGERYGKHLK